MKKRILALALAGTTAFSVFGAAMSANAASYDSNSTHAEWNIDRYKPYTPAGDIGWSSKELTAADKYVQINNNNYFVETGTATTIDPEYKRAHYPVGTTIYAVNKNAIDDFTGVKSDYNFVNLKDEEYYGITVEDLMTDEDVGYVQLDGIANQNTGTIKVDNTTYYVGKLKNSPNEGYKIFNKAGYDAAVAARNFEEPTNNLFVLVDEDNFTNGKLDLGSALSVGVYVYNYNFDIDKIDQALQDKIEDIVGNNPYKILTQKDNEDHALTNLTSMNRGYVIKTDADSTDGIFLDVKYSTLDSTDPTDFDAVMENPVLPSGEVYLYDYYGNLPNAISADMFTRAWNTDKNSVASLLARYSTGSGTLEYDRGFYGAKGVRAEVVDEWENFLDDLGIADTSSTSLTAWAADTVKNYSYQYYDGLVVTYYKSNADGSYTITYESGKNIDLYNFAELIANIIELAPATAVYDAQTSELVYLMQQYEKYMDGYVDPVPADTNDWGDLLVSLAQAPTEDEFATANAYTRYSNRVDELVADYEDASTSAAIKSAETALYNFVIDYDTRYKYESKPTTTALSDAIDSTYYNYKWSGTSYTNDNGTPKKTTDDLTVAAGYYVGAYEKYGVLYDGSKAAANVTDTNLTPVALYPVGDYSGSVTDGAYPGVGGTGVYYVSQEYNWFYNVYALAYDVLLAGNKYQSTIDLMATTLEEAIDALVPTTSATAADVLGAEEQNDEIADLVETDYKAAMWANRNKIYNYITERVSNHETGHYGATNAEILAKEAAYFMGWQNYQTTVTRSEINSVSTARTEAQNALTALRNDEENYNAAQANALQKAIDECDVIIDLYNGDYSKSKNSQSVNGTLALQVGDKDQILKSDCDKAVEAVDAAINFKNIIQGWSQDEDDNWMYGTEEGYLNDGWHQVDGGKTWFYFNEDGTAKQSEWWQDGSTWYYFNKNCGAAVGWAQVDGKWYFFKGNNAMKTGWEKVEGSWYYLSSSGAMVTGWAQIDGKWYYFSKESNALGQMLANTTTPDGYKVDANGVLVD